MDGFTREEIERVWQRVHDSLTADPLAQNKKHGEAETSPCRAQQYKVLLFLLLALSFRCRC